MASNLVAQGVTGASASDGLTTLANKILDIQTGGSCYHIEFSKSSYTAVNGACTITCTLQQNYAPLPNVTITLSDGTSQYSSITNSNGVAEFSLTGLVSSAAWTCSYSNVSDTCSISVVNYIINDDCSVDDSSTLFGDHISLRNSGTCSVSYDSNNKCYVITNTKGSAEAFLEFLPLRGVTDSFKITFRSKNLTSATCPIGLYYYLDSNNWGGVKDESTNMWVSSKTNGSFTESNKGGTDMRTLELIHEAIFDSTNKTLTLHRYDINMNLIKTITMNIPSSITIDSSVIWGTSVTWDNNAIREIYNIQAEYI